jgi:hypothetical protein
MPDFTCDVLIVGGGSRALLLLERLGMLLGREPGRRLHVVVAEPRTLGPGIHQTGQGSHIRFNTPSSCPTIFANRGIPGIGQGTEGPSFREWAGLGETVSGTDFQPRARIGEYLAWSASHIVASLPPTIHFEHLRETISGARVSPAGTLEYQTTGTAVHPRACVLAIGHSMWDTPSDLMSATGLISNPFPTGTKLSAIDEGHAVALRGMGLTALDVVAELTVGRGGRFESCASGRPRYFASGKEPSIVLFSRSGMPIRMRPDGRWPAADAALLVLDASRLGELHRTSMRLSFEQHVFPLLLAEMTCRLAPHEPRGFASLPASLQTWWKEGRWTDGAMEIAQVFRSREAVAYFDALLRPVNVADGGATRHAEAFLREDLGHSSRGTGGSVLKHALEVLLEARCFVKSLSDYHDDRLSDFGWVQAGFAAIVNRNVIGPHAERGAELLALFEGGHLVVAPAGTVLRTSAQGANWLVSPSGEMVSRADFIVAADHPRMASGAEARFVRSLFAIGAASPSAGGVGTGGMRVDRHLRILPHKSQVGFPLWASGPPCEGSSYYNNYIPCLQADALFPYLEAESIAASLTSFLWGSATPGS